MFKGERVTLRAFKREDMQVQWLSENNAELYFWDGGTPSPKKMEAMYAHYDKSGDDNTVTFAIEADGQYIGHCGLYRFDRVARHCELGIEIGNKSYWGKGYGREVVRLLLDYGFKHLNANRVWLGTHSENERAMRCYLACGFIEEGRMRQHIWIDGRYVDRVTMGILRSDFEAASTA